MRSKRQRERNTSFIADMMLNRLINCDADWVKPYIILHPETGTFEFMPEFYSNALAIVDVIIDEKCAGEILGYADESVLFLARHAGEWDSFESIMDFVMWLENLKADGDIKSFKFRFVGNRFPISKN